MLCEHDLSADAKYSSKTIQSGHIYRWNCLNFFNSICIRAKFDYIGDPSQMCRGLTGTNRRPLSGATSDYVASGSAGYENQALICFLIAIERIMISQKWMQSNAQ